MDILHLVDRLEELVNEARQLPMSNKIILDEDRLIDLIDQMRVSIPEEVKQAQKVVAERDRMMAQGQEKAERTVAMAEQRAAELTEQQPVTQQAKDRAEEIIHKAKIDAEAIRADADEYVIETLERMEVEIEHVLQQVKNGLLKLRTDRNAVANRYAEADD